MCMSRGPSGPSPELIKQQQDAAKRQEALLQQQLDQQRASSEAMRVASEAAQKETNARLEKARQEQLAAQEAIDIKKAKTEAAKTKAESNIGKARGRASLKIDKQAYSVGNINPIDSLVNLPV